MTNTQLEAVILRRHWSLQVGEVVHGHRAKCSFKISLTVLAETTCLITGRAPEGELQIHKKGSTFACVELLGIGA